MKTKVFILTAILFFTGINLYSQANKLTHAIELNEIGKPNVVISTDKTTSELVMKSTYSYNTDGNRQSKTLYIRNKKNNEWIEDSQTEYFYNASGQLKYCSYRKWDKRKQCFNSESTNMNYIYNESGNLQSINYTKSKEINSVLFTQK